MPQPMNAIINDEKFTFLAYTKRNIVILINRRDKKRLPHRPI